MRFLLLSVLILGFIVSGCDASKKAVKTDVTKDCTPLKKVKNSAFIDLSSARYELNDLRQNGNNLEFDIISSAELTGAELYWTGAVRKSYPPQASVKLILSDTPVATDTNSRSKNKHSFCFDISEMDSYGERMKIYIMDDEEAIDFKFKKK